jgi:DNA gyrase subunit A
MGAGGMRGIKLSTEEKAVAGGVLRQSDRVIGAAIAHDDRVLWTITDSGFAKYTPLSEYPTQGRAGSGVIAMKLPGDAGLAAAVTGTPTDDVIILTSKGRPKQVKLAQAPLAKRSGKGDNIIAVWNKEVVAGAVVFQRMRPLAETSSLAVAAAETDALAE